jgi:3-oxoacyl-[acyl-carrier-protein] synthase-3
MSKSVGIRALAVSFPDVVRTNDYWRNKYPDAVADAQQRTLARLFSAKSAAAPTEAFDIEMAPYLSDPFRGTVERRALVPGETSIDIERRAAERVLAAAGMRAEEVGAVMVASMIPDTIGLGNAAHLTKRMGLSMPAWNVESACCGAVVTLQTASALVRSGDYGSVLVIVSSANSRLLDDRDSLSWFMADGAGAFLVGEVPAGEGVLGTKVIGTQETCNAFVFEAVPAEDGGGKGRVQLRGGDESAGRLMRERSEPQLRTCVDGALAAAGVTLDDIHFFVFNTPVAWFARFCARALGIDPERTISMYPSYGNIGPALTTANLYHAAQSGKIRKGDLVLVYAVGSVSTAGATVMRCGDVALGPLPSTDVVRL